MTSTILLVCLNDDLTRWTLKILCDARCNDQGDEKMRMAGGYFPAITLLGHFVVILAMLEASRYANL